MTAGDTARRGITGTRAMTNRTICFALALLATAAVSSQARAGMSGTSERIEQQNITQAQAGVPQQQAQAPQRRSVARPEQPGQPSGGGFDGTWAVASSPGCGLVARSAVRVARGRIRGRGVNGSIDASGNVRTVSYGGGLSVVSKGRVSGTSGSGTYQVSTGCTGTWVAQKA